MGMIMNDCFMSMQVAMLSGKAILVDVVMMSVPMVMFMLMSSCIMLMHMLMNLRCHQERTCQHDNECGQEVKSQSIPENHPGYEYTDKRCRCIVSACPCRSQLSLCMNIQEDA